MNGGEFAIEYTAPPSVASDTTTVVFLTVILNDDDNTETILTINIIEPPSNCLVYGSNGVEEKNDKIKWSLANVGPLPVTLDYLDITWPGEQCGNLIAIKLDDKFFKGSLSPPNAILKDLTNQFVVGSSSSVGSSTVVGGGGAQFHHGSGTSPSLSDLILDSGEIDKLEIEFEKDCNGEEEGLSYAINVGFVEGCSVALTTASTDTTDDDLPF